ncbi:hypothetical protein KM043_013130 [Ampulex compressa]|nr:hypothetical protein KM043_013130 [Ampulex compressa]
MKRADTSARKGLTARRAAFNRKKEVSSVQCGKTRGEITWGIEDTSNVFDAPRSGATAGAVVAVESDLAADRTYALPISVYSRSRLHRAAFAQVTQPNIAGEKVFVPQCRCKYRMGSVHRKSISILDFAIAFLRARRLPAEGCSSRVDCQRMKGLSNSGEQSSGCSCVGPKIGNGRSRNNAAGTCCMTMEEEDKGNDCDLEWEYEISLSE